MLIRKNNLCECSNCCSFVDEKEITCSTCGDTLFEFKREDFKPIFRTRIAIPDDQYAKICLLDKNKELKETLSRELNKSFIEYLKKDELFNMINV